MLKLVNPLKGNLELEGLVHKDLLLSLVLLEQHKDLVDIIQEGDLHFPFALEV